MNHELGLVKVTSASPLVKVGNIDYNIEQIEKVLDVNKESDIVVFPELCITGYTCGDLFQQDWFVQKAIEETAALAKRVPEDQMIVVGLPLVVPNKMYNCAVVLNNAKIAGVVPKTFIPNYKEFYEQRWFSKGESKIKIAGAPFGNDLLFSLGNGITVGIEICEDLWGPIPRSSLQAVDGASILLNLSASNETVEKVDYRRKLIEQQSARCVAGYVYASAGPSESTSDIVMSGHCLIAEDGKILKEDSPLEYFDCRLNEANTNRWITSDIDVQKLEHSRIHSTSFSDNEYDVNFERVSINIDSNIEQKIDRDINLQPFIGYTFKELDKRMDEAFSIQTIALSKRLKQLPETEKFVIGVSGGLDSTLALLALVHAVDISGFDRKRILGITMPCFGTSDKTLENSINLMNELGIDYKNIDIKAGVLRTFKDIGHDPFGIEVNKHTLVSHFEEGLSKLSEKRVKKGDLVFENVQARRRTEILMAHGFVVGTGDMSEIALGWCTYNGDHMSMYNVNCSIPKTLVREMIKRRIEMDMGWGNMKEVLQSILDTTISPELLPRDVVSHDTEKIIGSYILHDFFLYNFIKHGYSPKKILEYACVASYRGGDSTNIFSREEIKKTLVTFIKRFFQNQFKRDCVPNGPKIGSISLSPRGDWRMPSDADVTMWLKELEDV